MSHENHAAEAARADPSPSSRKRWTAPRARRLMTSAAAQGAGSHFDNFELLS